MSSFARASYTPTSKLFHWVTALLILTLYVLVWSIDDKNKPLEAVLVGLHESVGMTVWLLVVARLAWRTMAGVPALPAGLPQWQRIAARAVQYLLYLLIFVQPMTGFISANLFDGPVPWFGLFSVPALVETNKELGKQIFGFHELVGNLLMYAVLLHSAAALYHHFIRKDDVLRSMLPGRSA